MGKMVAAVLMATLVAADLTPSTAHATPPPAAERASTPASPPAAVSASPAAVSAAPPAAVSASPPAATPAAPASASAAVQPMNAEARGHYDRGIELFTAKDYPGAILELEIGYAVDARPEFLFAEAQALRLQGDCKSAVPIYQKFLASQPSALQVSATQIALARCAQQLATAEPPAPLPPPTLTSPTPAPPPPPRPPHPIAAAPPGWSRDPLSALLLGAGVVGLGAGAGFMLAAFSTRAAANDARSYADYSQRFASAQARLDVAIVSLAAGTALTAAAIYRFMRRSHEPEPAVAAGPASWRAWWAPALGGPGTAGLEGRF
jgi:hypothetical protein